MTRDIAWTLSPCINDTRSFILQIDGHRLTMGELLVRDWVVESGWWRRELLYSRTD